MVETQGEVVLGGGGVRLGQSQFDQDRSGMGRGEDLVLGRHQAAGGQRQHQDDGADDPIPLPAAPVARRHDRPTARRPARRLASALLLVGQLGIEDLARAGPGPDRSDRHHRHRHLGLVGQNGRAEPVHGQRLLVSGRVERKGLRGRQRTGQRAQSGGQAGGVQAVLDLGCRRPRQHLVQRPERRIGGQRNADPRHQGAHRRVRHEGHGAGDRLVEHQGQRVHVGPSVHLLALGRLGGGIAGRADHRPRRFGPGRFGQGPGHAEVGHAHPALLVEEEVRRLDVAVHQARGSGHRPDPAPPRPPTGRPASGSAVRRGRGGRGTSPRRDTR